MSFFVFLFVFSGIFLYSTFFAKKARFLRILKKTPQTPLVKLPPKGIAHTQGKITAIHPSKTSPLLQKKSVGYQYCLAKQRGKNTFSIVDHITIDDFLLESEGQFCLVPSTNIKFILLESSEVSSHTMSKPSPAELELLVKYKQDPKQILSSNMSYVYQEGVLELGQELCIFGRYHTQSITEFPELADIVPASTLKVFYAQVDEPIYITNFRLDSVKRILPN